MFHSLITRAALGRTANIGDLYDATTDKFVNRSMLKVRASDLTFELDVDETSTNVFQSGSFVDKMDAFDVEPELQLSVMSGMVNLGDSWELAGDGNVEVGTLKSQLICNVKTVTSEINVQQNKQQIDTDILSAETEATHVVVGITWGAVYSISCHHALHPNKSRKNTEEELGEMMEKIKKAIATEGTLEKSTSNASSYTFIFKCDSKFSPLAQELKGTYENVLTRARSMLTFLKESENGKGVPLMYTLMPLESVSKLFKPKIAMKTFFNALDQNIIRKTVCTAEKLSNMKTQTQKIHAKLHASENYSTVETLAQVDEYARKLSEDASSFTEQLEFVVTKIRKQKGDTKKLEILQNDWAKYCQGKNCIADFEAKVQMLEMIKMWQDERIYCIGRKDQLDVNIAHHVYIFYTSGAMADTKVERLFWKYHASCSDRKDTAFVAINASLRPDLCHGEQCIKVYTAGRCTCEDLYKKEGENAESCLVQSKQKTKVDQIPKRAQLTICCPGSISLQCPKERVDWKCFDCKMVIDYGLETGMCYCNCGSFKVSDTQFRCNSNHHGLSFVDYPWDFLQTELSHLQPFLEKNILILGETGVGKSTWINGVYNYINFPDLKSAKDTKNPLALIPARFTFRKDDTSYDVKIGEGSAAEEKLETGCCATRIPKSYLFKGTSYRIRLIDTPGVGDIDGLEQDKKNFHNILQFLSFFEEIHAICIILQPNCSRLTVMFRFCILELLTQLHSSAAKNILFCFTNTRSTFYQPGDTFDLLNKMFEDNRIELRVCQENSFCFDNEAFRFLACLQNGLKFSEEEEELYAKSWEKSVNVTTKMFALVRDLPPHTVRNTISMNEARRITLELSKPMTEVAARIQDNEVIANKEKDAVQENTVRMDELREGLSCKVYDLRRENLSHAITVCTNNECIEEVEVGREKSKEVVYKKVCHDPCDCFLWWAAPKTRYTRSTGWCRCIRYMYLFSQSCTNCGHGYTDHMYIDYRLIQVEKELIDEDIQQQILQRSTEKEQKEEYIRQIDKKIEELEDEKKTIIKASAKFVAFLKQHALIPFNDAVKDYIEMTIEQETKKTQDEKRIDSMKELLYMYEEHKKSIDENKEDYPISPEDINSEKDKLFSLKHFGGTLEHIFNEISLSKSAQNASFPEQVVHLRETETTTACWYPSWSSLNQGVQSSSRLVKSSLNYFFQGWDWVNY